jgi:hypothetical protein
VSRGNDWALLQSQINTKAATSGKLSQFASTTSAELAGVISDETGTGFLVFSDSPTFGGTVVLPSTTSIGSITSTELGYVDGVTSAIQTQFGTRPIADTTGARIKSNITSAVAVTATNGSSTAFTITYGGTAFSSVPAITITARLDDNPTTNSVFAFLSGATTTSSAPCRGQRVTGNTTTSIYFYWIATNS